MAGGLRRFRRAGEGLERFRVFGGGGFRGFSIVEERSIGFQKPELVSPTSVSISVS